MNSNATLVDTESNLLVTGPSELEQAKLKSTWTRIMRMDYGLGGLPRVSEIPLLGKRGKSCEADCPNKHEVESVQHAKHGKVVVNSLNCDDGAMRLLSRNYQGLRNHWTSRSVHKIVREQAPTMCFLMETWLDKEGFEKLYGELPFPNRIIVKHPNSGGGLAVIWKNEVQLQLVNYTANHILVKVREDDGFEWWLTSFYGWPEACHQYKSWELLTHLRTFVEGPWLCIGYFNAIIQFTE